MVLTKYKFMAIVANKVLEILPDSSYKHSPFINSSQAFITLFQHHGLNERTIYDKIDGLDEEKKKSSIFRKNAYLVSPQ